MSNNKYIVHGLKGSAILYLKKSGSTFSIKYFNEETSVHILICRGREADLDNETKRLNIKPDQVISIIPLSMGVSLWQIMFGVLEFKLIQRFRPNIYGKIRNKGLLLSMLITGEKQLSDMISRLRREYRRSSGRYLIISLEKPSNLPGCEAYVETQSFIGVKPLIKNIDNYLRLI